MQFPDFGWRCYLPERSHRRVLPCAVLIRYLGWCKRQHTLASVASAQVYLASPAGPPDAAGREALRWFFRSAFAQEAAATPATPPRIDRVIRDAAVSREIPPLAEHRQGLSAATRCRGPWRLIYYEAYVEVDDALGRERFLKSGAGRTYLKKQCRRFFESNPLRSAA